MKSTRRLHELGQSIWLDNITRQMLDDGTLSRYVAELSVTGLTSNPTIFDEAIRGTAAYDRGIAAKSAAGLSGEALFLELALEDLARAADVFRPIYDASGGIDGWVSMEVSPLLADDAAATVRAAREIRERARRDNLFVKIPGTSAGVTAIEESIFAGIPVNVTLLFSTAQYLAAADAYLRAVERRLAAGLDPRVGSVASVFVSRWDRAVAASVPPELQNRLGIAVAMDTYRAYCELHASPRWRRLEAAGALRQRLLWASTGVKDPQASPNLYVEALAAPDTIDTMPEKTLLAFADSGAAGALMPRDGGEARHVLAQFSGRGVDVQALAARLQADGAQAFVKSWNDLLARIGAKSAALATA